MLSKSSPRPKAVTFFDIFSKTDMTFKENCVTSDARIVEKVKKRMAVVVEHVAFV